MKFIKDMFNRNSPKIGREFYKIETPNRIYYYSKILDINNNFYVLKPLYILEIPAKNVKIALIKQNKKYLSNLLTIRTGFTPDYYGHIRDNLAFTRLTTEFFRENFKEIQPLLHPFLEFEKNIVKFQRSK
jgi:hypothetical protein